MGTQDRLGQRVVVAIRTLPSPAEILANARRKILEETILRLRGHEFEKKTRVPLSDLPLPRWITNAGSRQFHSAISIHERAPGENREGRKIRARGAIFSTTQEQDELAVVPGLCSPSLTGYWRTDGIAGSQEQ